MRGFRKLIFGCLLLVCSGGPAFGAFSPDSVEILSGFGWSKVRHFGNYLIVPLRLDFGFDLGPWALNRGVNPPGLLQLGLEPYLAYAFEPRNNVEVGASVAFKVGFRREDQAIQPYLVAGLGGLYLSQHFREQSTQFNFTEFIGLGTRCLLTRHAGFTLEYRFRHISNARISEPNGGVEGHLIMLGRLHSF